MAVKIKTYNVSQGGIRGRHITLPRIWLDDLDLKIGDKITVYRDEANRLILCPPGVAAPPPVVVSIQAREIASTLADLRGRGGSCPETSVGIPAEEQSR